VWQILPRITAQGGHSCFFLESSAKDELNDLLLQFLSLNSSRHHPLILNAFTDLWNRNVIGCFLTSSAKKGHDYFLAPSAREGLQLSGRSGGGAVAVKWVAKQLA
jgi:hypothetical protein